jgi:hypothetical protein
VIDDIDACVRYATDAGDEPAPGHRTPPPRDE